MRAFVCRTEGENVRRAQEKLSYLKRDKDKRETGKPRQQERQNQKDRKAEWDSECERKQEKEEHTRAREPQVCACVRDPEKMRKRCDREM